MADNSLLGRRLANFELQRVLGRGGRVEVYYGLDVKLQRPVAVKVIDALYRSNPAYAARFVREAAGVLVGMAVVGTGIVICSAGAFVALGLELGVAKSSLWLR